MVQYINSSCHVLCFLMAPAHAKSIRMCVAMIGLHYWAFGPVVAIFVYLFNLLFS